MNCPSCGKEVKDNAKFCALCGESLNMASEKPLMTAKGLGGNLELYENKITIIRKGLRALTLQGVKGDKDIAIKQISSIQMKMPGLLANGYIQFAFVGGQEAKGGIFQATQDENSVMFNKKQEADFVAIKKEIENRIFNPAGPSPNAGINDLEKLADLKNKGIITEEEFSQKKKQILGL